MSNPWGKFFWSDWETDAGLKLCSYAAQGLWMRMLCIAAQHDPVGYVAVNGIPLDAQTIARMTGGSEPEVAALLDELERTNVFSRARNRCIYSRRMIRDGKLSQARAAAGREGASVTNSKTKGKNRLPQQNSGNDTGKLSANGSAPEPEARDQKEEAPKPPKDTPMNPKVREVMDAAGFIALPPDLKLIGDWEGIGADFQRDILPILRRVSSEYRGRTGRGLVNLGFFNLEVRRKVADDAAKASAQARSMARMRRIEEDQNREAAK